MRTMSRSETMPTTRSPAPVTTRAPMRRSASSFAASARLAVGEMVTTLPPLSDRMRFTVMSVASLQEAPARA